MTTTIGIDPQVTSVLCSRFKTGEVGIDMVTSIWGVDDLLFFPRARHQGIAIRRPTDALEHAFGRPGLPLKFINDIISR